MRKPQVIFNGFMDKNNWEINGRFRLREAWGI